MSDEIRSRKAFTHNYMAALLIAEHAQIQRRELTFTADPLNILVSFRAAVVGLASLPIDTYLD